MYDIKNQQLAIFKIEELISNINITKKITAFEYENMKKLYFGYPSAKLCLSTFNLQIVVKNLQIALNDLSLVDNIKTINNIQDFIFLDIAYSNDKIKMSNLDVYVTFIEDPENNIEDSYIRNYLINITRYINPVTCSIDFIPFYNKINQKIDDNNIKMSNLFPGAKLSPLTTIFGLSDKTYKKLTPNDKKINKSSYSIKCFCSKKYTINDDNINLMVEIDDKSKNVIFNCIHSGTNTEGGKFFIKKDDHEFFKSNPSETETREWFMQNFKSLVRMKNVPN